MEEKGQREVSEDTDTCLITKFNSCMLVFMKVSLM